jgi:uncharacterized membrane protein (UPF0127 family)
MGPRLAKLETATVLGVDVPVAAQAKSRLLGLAWLEPEEAGSGLLLPRCRSVHTFGMRFALDVAFLDSDWRPIRIVRAVPPGRVVLEFRARAVLETPSPGAAGGESAGSPT